MKTIHDFNNSYLRKIWEATCGRMGYPDPAKKDGNGNFVHQRQYECAMNYNIKQRVTEDTMYEKAHELGISGHILPIKSKHERTAVLQHFTVNFTDLKSGSEPVTVSLQYGGRATRPDVDIALQNFGGQKILFQKMNIDTVDDPNMCMYLDLCRQAVDSPIYLPEQVQRSFGFILELVDAPVKQTSRVIRAIGFDRKTEAPKAVLNDNKYELEAYITTAPSTKLRVIARALNKDVTGMADHAIRAMLRQMASDPVDQSKLSVAIGDDRESVLTAIRFLDENKLLEFKQDNQWYLRDHAESGEWVALNGTVMADLTNDIDVAKQRLCSLIMGEGAKGATPRRDILREFRRVMELNERKVTDRAERRNPLDSDAQAAVREQIVEAMTDGLIKFYPKGAKWSFTDKPNANESMIVSMANALPDQKPFDVLFEFILTKKADWLEEKLKGVREAVTA
jgi:hypothetical protein